MTDKPNLADARRVTEAATEGPWTFSDTTDVRGHKGEFRTPSPDNGFMLVGPWCNDADAEFIAASRTLVPALLAAVEAVLAAHIKHRDSHDRPRPINGPWFCCARVQLGAIAMDDCQECGDLHPCPTVRAITAHLDIEPR